MSGSLGKVKGFKNDKRNLLEATHNLVVFGTGQFPPDVLKGRRVLRRGQTNHNYLRKTYYNASASPSARQAGKSKSVPPTGPNQVDAHSIQMQMQRNPEMVPKDLMLNYFSNTKPWISGSKTKTSKSSGDKPPLEREGVEGNSNNNNNNLSRSSNFEKRRSLSRPKSTKSTRVEVPQNQQPQQPQQGMSLESAIFANDIVCPICLKGFEPVQYNTNVPVSEMMRQSLAAYQQQVGKAHRKTLEEGWGMNTPKCVLHPQDIVVSANCGELFHKLCLREWCARTHSNKFPRTQKPVATCPSCGKELKFTVCQEIECHRNFSDEPTRLDRELNRVKQAHKQLQLLWPRTSIYLKKVRQDIMDTQTIYNELKAKKRLLKLELRQVSTDELSIMMNKVSNADDLKALLKKQEKALQFMEEETLQIMRMYLLTLVRKFKESNGNNENAEDNALGERVPLSLIPHLNAILNDDEALTLLSRLICPRTNDKKDAESMKQLEIQILQKCMEITFCDVKVDTPIPLEQEEEEELPHKCDTYTLLQVAKANQLQETEVNILTLKPEVDLANNNNNENNENGPRKDSKSKPMVKPLEQVRAEENDELEKDESTTSTYISDTLLSILKECSATHLIPTNAVSDSAMLGVPQDSTHSIYRHHYKQKPPRLCRVIEIAESEIYINTSAEFSTGREKAEPVSEKIIFERAKGYGEDNLSKTSSMDVVATSIAPTATSAVSSDSSIEVDMDESEGLLKGKGSMELKEVPQTILYPTPQSSVQENNELLPVAKSSMAKRICSLVQEKFGEPEVNHHESLNEVQDGDCEPDCEILRISKSLDDMRPRTRTITPKREESPPKLKDIEDTEEVEDDKSWTTVNEDEDEEEEKELPLPSESFDYSNLVTKESSVLSSEITPMVDAPPNPYTDKDNGTSCQVVFSQRSKAKEVRQPTAEKEPEILLPTPTPITMEPLHSKSSLSHPLLKKPTGELSIAIMYILEDEGMESSEDNEAEKEKLRMDSAKLIEPIYVTAEKASRFSLVAGASSDGEEPIMETSEEFHIRNVESYLKENYRLQGQSQNRIQNLEVPSLVDDDLWEEQEEDEEEAIGGGTSWPVKGIKNGGRPLGSLGGHQVSSSRKNAKDFNSANFLFQNKFGYQHEHIVSLPLLNGNIEPRMYIENEKVINRPRKLYGTSGPFKYQVINK